MASRIALILLVLGLLIVPSLCRPNASVRRVVTASAASSQGNVPEEDSGTGDGEGNGEGVGEVMEGRAMDPLATGTQCNVTGACLICTEQQKVEDPACQPTGYRQAISCIERYSGAVSSLPSARARSAGATKPRGGVVRGPRQARGEAGGRGSGKGREDGGELQEGGREDGPGEGREAQEIIPDGRSGGSGHSESSGGIGSSGRRIQEETDGARGSKGASGPQSVGSHEQQGVDETAGGLSASVSRRVRLQEETVVAQEGEYREGVLTVGTEEGSGVGLSGSARGAEAVENERREKFEVAPGWGSEEGKVLLRRLLGEVRTVQVAGRVSSMEASAEEEGARGSSTSSDGSGEGVGEERMRRFLTYESCKPEVETLSVLGFEGIMLAILAVCGPIVYHRKRKAGMQAGTVRLSNSSNRF